MKITRWLLGKLILLAHVLTLPKKGKRHPQEQAKVNAITQDYSLYQFQACPFCVKVRREIRRLGLSIELRNAKTDGPYRTELLRHGGKIKVPCLQINKKNGTTQWMYESSDIIQHLKKNFPVSTPE